MLIVALVLAVIGLAALVTAVVTSNALIAWVCIGASVVGVVLLIVDALRERSLTMRSDEADAAPKESSGGMAPAGASGAEETALIPVTPSAEDYPDEGAEADINPSVVSPGTSAERSDEADDGGAEPARI